LSARSLISFSRQGIDSSWCVLSSYRCTSSCSSVRSNWPIISSNSKSEFWTSCCKTSPNGVRTTRDWSVHCRPSAEPPQWRNFRFCFSNASGKCKIESLNNRLGLSYLPEDHTCWIYARRRAPIGSFSERTKITGGLCLGECFDFRLVSSSVLSLKFFYLDDIRSHFTHFLFLALMSPSFPFFLVLFPSRWNWCPRFLRY